MSKDNVLKKEFKKKDVQRLRNVMTGKAGERTTEGVGYTKTQEFHEEGDVWEENGRQWTIKDGIKQNITKLDRFKELNTPMFCPSCKKIMKHSNDDRMYKQYQHCFSCHIEFETTLKAKGLWQAYKQEIINKDIDAIINDYKAWTEEMLTASNQGFVTEAGDVENWKGKVNKEKVALNLEETVKYLEGLKK